MYTDRFALVKRFDHNCELIEYCCNINIYIYMYVHIRTRHHSIYKHQKHFNRFSLLGPLLYLKGGISSMERDRARTRQRAYNCFDEYVAICEPAHTHTRSSEIYDVSVLYVNFRRRTAQPAPLSEELRSTSQSNGGDDKEESICAHAPPQIVKPINCYGRARLRRSARRLTDIRYHVFPSHTRGEYNINNNKKEK